MSRPAGSRLEVLEVEMGPRSPRLRGSFLGAPAAGDVADPPELLLRGWVLPESGPALGIEIVYGESVVGRSGADLPRPDIAEAHGDLPHAGRCGFEHSLDHAAATGNLSLRVRAVLDPTHRIPIATLAVRIEPAAAETVTVVIPCFKQAHFLPEAIESVLAQNHGRTEIVVIDDGSPDNVGEVAARYPGVRCLRQPNGGLAAARNTGLEQAKDEFVVFLDADDRLLPEAVSAGLSALRIQPEAMMAAGTWLLIGEEGEPLPADPPQQPVKAYPALLEGCFISSPAAVLYRRQLFDVIGGFDPSVSASADYDLYLRTAASFPVCLHAKPVAEYRRHGANMTRDAELILAAETAVLERQAPHVEGSPDLCEALERGLKRSRDYHGERIRLLQKGSD